MSIGTDGICKSCGRDFQGELADGSPCPEQDDCPSHVMEKGKYWWCAQTDISDIEKCSPSASKAIATNLNPSIKLKLREA